MRLAHFSDVHALSLKGVSPLAFLNKRVAGYADWLLHRRDKYSVALFEALVDDLNRERPDEVVVTGDLTNLGLPAEFNLVRGILDRLAAGADHVTIVPGNHDVYTVGALLTQEFSRVLGRYATSDATAGVNFPIVRTRGPVAIIGVSTAFPSPPMFADGWVGRKQLDELERVLTVLRDAGKFRVLLLHHPPYANRRVALRGLRDRGGLERLLSQVGCELVLHGHEHCDVRREMVGPKHPIPVIGVGSATFQDPRRDRRARYNLYTIQDGALTSIETRIHDPESGHFVSA